MNLHKQVKMLLIIGMVAEKKEDFFYTMGFYATGIDNHKEITLYNSYGYLWGLAFKELMSLFAINDKLVVEEEIVNILYSARSYNSFEDIEDIADKKATELINKYGVK